MTQNNPWHPWHPWPSVIQTLRVTSMIIPALLTFAITGKLT
jgi:hypothetical protein